MVFGLFIYKIIHKIAKYYCQITLYFGQNFNILAVPKWLLINVLISCRTTSICNIETVAAVSREVLMEAADSTFTAVVSGHQEAWALWRSCLQPVSVPALTCVSPAEWCDS